MKTVFFGPFIGEFGWEVLFWQGWVRKACQGPYKNYRKIVCSFPGRAPLYPYADEYWPLSEEFLNLKSSAQNYFTDCWRHGYPGKQISKYHWKSFAKALVRWEKPQKRATDTPFEMPDVEPVALAMLEAFKKQLPADTVYFVPWKWNQVPDSSLEFGVKTPEVPRLDRVRTKRIPFSEQLLEYLTPTPKGTEALKARHSSDQKLISVFPRCRVLRRADKNWSKENYLELIRSLQADFPEYRVAIVGEPGGAFFADGVPEGCLDLINVPKDLRVDIQLAALQNSAFSIGSMSGAILFSLAAGCPSLTWGYLEEQDRYHYENFMGTSLIYYADINPKVEMIQGLSHSLLRMARANGQVAETSENSVFTPTPRSSVKTQADLSH